MRGWCSFPVDSSAILVMKLRWHEIAVKWKRTTLAGNFPVSQKGLSKAPARVGIQESCMCWAIAYRLSTVTRSFPNRLQLHSIYISEYLSSYISSSPEVSRNTICCRRLSTRNFVNLAHSWCRIHWLKLCKFSFFVFMLDVCKISYFYAVYWSPKCYRAFDSFFQTAECLGYTLEVPLHALAGNRTWWMFRCPSCVFNICGLASGLRYKKYWL